MSRKGISILEVLFAIGVISIGLLGVMSVVPVALHTVGQGTIVDRSSRAGHNAMREFHTRGMARADQWVYYHAQNSVSPARGWSRVTWSRGVDGVWGSTNDDDGSMDGPFDQFGGTRNQFDNVAEAGWINGQGRPFDLLIDSPTPGVCFCIDPRLLAARDPNTGLPNWTRTPGNTATNGNEFPYRRIATPSTFESPLLKMQRVSLRRTWKSGSITEPPMNKALADQVFITNDDLIYDVPEEANNPPTQQILRTVAGDPVLRQYDGDFSWMATLVPKRDQVGAISNSYNLSIVVFHRRDPLLEMNLNNERVAYIPTRDFHSGGITGGDVSLHSYLGSPIPQEELAVKSGDWVLLGALLARPGGESFPYFRWYRIRSVGDVIPNPDLGNWKRDLTLDGADWPIAAVRLHPSVAETRDHTRVTLVRNVVAVFERTITLETNSNANLEPAL